GRVDGGVEGNGTVDGGGVLELGGDARPDRAVAALLKSTTRRGGESTQNTVGSTASSRSSTTRATALSRFAIPMTLTSAGLRMMLLRHSAGPGRVSNRSTYSRSGADSRPRS